VSFIGSIKWLERAPFGNRELHTLRRDANYVPGQDEDTLLIGVSRSGFTSEGLDAEFGPYDLMEAWAAPIS
jgi:hypothetical protein